MIPIGSGVRVWIATGHTDTRRGMNTLALMVQQRFIAILTVVIFTFSAARAAS
jgi:predicted S18 family serine protease